eukprot:s1355_g10.t1
MLNLLEERVDDLFLAKEEKAYRTPLAGACRGVGFGRAGAFCCVVARCCFAELPSAMSSATCLLGGDGIAWLLSQLVGAVASGELASAGVVVTIGVSSMALGGSCGPPFACAGVDVV